jgi:peptidoglycan/LPS O-acetylase OafA/YrhL
LKNYIKHLDGIRAISVISVIIYHAKIDISGSQVLSGGYLGVDLFFVISGYIIAYVITKEFEIKNNFSLLDFIDRRIRRIFPVILFSILIFQIPFFVSLIPSSLSSYAESINSIFLFNTNFHFNYINQQYGDDSSLEKPFLHMWSIALEFQFYFFISFLYLIFFKYFKESYILFLIVIIFILSLIYCEVNYKINSISNFYLPFPRFWEFLLGIILLYFEKKKLLQNRKKYYFILPSIGMLIILVCLILFNNNSQHPSILTLVPLFGLALLLLFIRHNIFLQNLLNHYILNKIGKISFSLYVIHYPVFALARIIFNKQDTIVTLNLIKILIPITIFLLSILSYNFIEKSYRNRIIVSGKKFYFTLVIVSTLILLLNFITIKNQGFENRWIVQGYNLDKSHHIKQMSKLNQENIKKIDLKKIKDTSKKNVLILGNSLAADLFLGFILNGQKFHLVNFNYFPTQIHCINFYLGLEKNICKSQINNLNNFSHKDFKKILDEIDLLILYSKYYDNDLIHFNKALNNLKKYYRKKIIIINNQPFYKGKNKFGTIWWYDLDDFVHQHQRIPNKQEVVELEKKYFINSKNNFFKIPKKNTEILKIAKIHNIKVIDLYEKFCSTKERSCKFITNQNKLIFRDYAHFTLNGLNLLIDKLDKEFQNFLK